MPDTFDHQIAAMVRDLIESSPSPHPAREVLDMRTPPVSLSLRSGLGRALAVAAAVLVVGSAGVWLGQSIDGDDLASQMSLTEGTPSPDLQFDPSQYGAEVRLLPSSGKGLPVVGAESVDGSIVAVGRLEGTDLEVFAWNTRDPENGACLEVTGFRAQHQTCSGVFDDGPRVAGPLVFPRLDESTGAVIDVVAVWQVPPETGIVVASTDEAALFQRPRGSVAAFTFGSGTSEVLLRALNADEQIIGIQELRLDDGQPGGDVSRSLDFAPESCPVTVPGEDGFTPASEAPPPPPDVYDEVWLGTPELWTMIKPEGEINSRRWLRGDRTFWWSESFLPDEAGEVVVTVERHGGTGPTGRFSATAGSGFDPFTLESTHQSVTMVGVDVPEPGCWELTAEYKGSEVTYVFWFDG